MKINKTYILPAIIIFIAVILRIRQFAVNRSLWIDEACLALNIVNRSFSELLLPLDANQGAPLGFLFTEKIMITLLGNRDFILRLFPLISGIIAIFLMCRIASLYLEHTGIIALYLFAVCQWLVYYASEVKQYSSDVMIFLLLLVAAHKSFSEPEPKQFILLSLICIISLWFSHPALFLIIAILATMTGEYLLKKDWQNLKWICGVILLQVINLVILYLISLRSLAANNDLIQYWQGSFMPLPPWQDLAWFSKIFSDILKIPGGLSFIPLSAVLLLTGYISFFFSQRQLAICLTLLFLNILIASGFEKYPVSGRLLLFIVPALYLMIAEGIRRIYLHLSEINKHGAVLALSLLTGLMIFTPTRIAYHNLIYPPMWDHIKPLISYINQHKKSGDMIYVYYATVPAFTYYAASYKIEESNFIKGIYSRQEPEKYIQDIEQRLDSHKRVWFIFSNNCADCKVNEEHFFLEYLDKKGRQADKAESLTSSLYLYDLVWDKENYNNDGKK